MTYASLTWYRCSSVFRITFSIPFNFFKKKKKKNNTKKKKPSVVTGTIHLKFTATQIE